MLISLKVQRREVYLHIVCVCAYSLIQIKILIGHLLCAKHCSGHWLTVVAQLLSCVRLFATPWTAARQASMSFTLSQSLLRFLSIKLVMPSNHLVLCHPLLLLPLIFPSIRVFSNDLALLIRWPKYWSIAISKADKNPCLVELTFCGTLYYWRDEGPFNSQLQIIRDKHLWFILCPHL